ncbi:hypothetical protein BDW59DRAFT_49789 [Aspergillus cavernicola]|uniref:Uncharacterized protein n=1 Tax=Aspergillus cavernicola TaxID=176166 RepID=A0ABR4IL17_9EURO
MTPATYHLLATVTTLARSRKTEFDNGMFKLNDRTSTLRATRNVSRTNGQPWDPLSSLAIRLFE